MKHILGNYETIMTIVNLILFTFNIYLFLSFAIKKERRVFKNLKKTIYLLQTGLEGMQTEHELFKENKMLFHVHDKVFNLSSDPLILNTIKSDSVLVVGYSETFGKYDALVQLAKTTNSALIVYAKLPHKITDAHLELFNSHKYYDMCQSIARLMTVVFNLAIIIPEKKK